MFHRTVRLGSNAMPPPPFQSQNICVVPGGRLSELDLKKFSRLTQTPKLQHDMSGKTGQLRLHGSLLREGAKEDIYMRTFRPPLNCDGGDAIDLMHKWWRFE